MTTLYVLGKLIGTVPFKKTRFFGHLWCKMGWLHIEIKYLKSPNKILIFLLQIDMNQIFQMRYYMTFNDNLKQSYRPSKFAVKKFKVALRYNRYARGDPGSIPDFGELWRLVTLQSFSLQGFMVPHLKDLIHIYLEQEDQDHSRTLKIAYALLNNPYFTS